MGEFRAGKHSAFRRETAGTADGLQRAAGRAERARGQLPEERGVCRWAGVEARRSPPVGQRP
ncbi:MAG: hypothetical protein HFE94_02775 [Acutalibacter sp.]|nr:hypothetical protein [Acutalibacter sp.]